MMKKLFLLVCFLQSVLFPVLGQYAPQAGITGSTAIVATSPLFKSWASGCTINRGLMDIAQPSLGYASIGDSISAIGGVDHFVVSLGDSGVATMRFPNLIVNGSGPDFAVFENGFVDPSNVEQAFLELAFVEVSSDGVNFFRFPSTSLTQVDTQIAGAGVYMDARKINNLAGKYISNYGTPFDLDEMTGIAGLDVNHITHVRVVDVVGAIGEYATYDAAGHKINDPYPTPFPIGGFDLDAVGVINQGMSLEVQGVNKPKIAYYPNPCTDVLNVRANEHLEIFITDVSGKMLKRTVVNAYASIPVSELANGIYFINIVNREGEKWVERFTKQ